MLADYGPPLMQSLSAATPALGPLPHAVVDVDDVLNMLSLSAATPAPAPPLHARDGIDDLLDGMSLSAATPRAASRAPQPRTLSLAPPPRAPSWLDGVLGRMQHAAVWPERAVGSGAAQRYAPRAAICISCIAAHWTYANPNAQILAAAGGFAAPGRTIDSHRERHIRERGPGGRQRRRLRGGGGGNVVARARGPAAAAALSRRRRLAPVCAVWCAPQWRCACACAALGATARPVSPFRDQ